MERNTRMKKRMLSGMLAFGMAVSLTAGSIPVSAEEEGGRELKVGATTAPQNISPFTSFTNRQPVCIYLYETLIEKDAEGNFYGILAKDWSTEDNITYDIEIYDYITDTEGNHITPEDVVFSLEHARDEAANTWIESAEVTGDYTVKVTLVDDAVSTFPTAMNRAPIVSKAAYEASEDSMTTTSVSTAPYMVTDFVPNVSITFEKNPNYWQTDESLQNPLYKEATVDKLYYTKISEAAQQTIALETGAIDVYANIANTEIGNFLEGGRDADNFTALGYASPTCYCFYYANQGICSEDLNLRYAIAHAIDKDVIVQGAFDGLAVVPTYMGAPDGMSDLTPSSASEDYFKYDPELAAEYLAKSSYNGEQLRLLVPNEDNHNRIAAIVQGQLMAIGLDVAITSYDNAMFQSSFGDGSAWDIAVCQMGMSDVAFVWSFLSWDLAGGDNGALGMAVKDEKLKEVLSTVNTIEGHTTENATIASDYINEMCYGQNLIATSQYYVFRKDLGAVDVPYLSMTQQDFFIACTKFE
ncbi:MAG: ABC transporter substrate-binding protein [Eubacteriales bacterium]|nr:ABC transporter substrate-binding protein [Eubacteriales bacterium]